MFCKNCGKEIDNAAVICPHCGVEQKNQSVTDNGGFGWGLLGCCVPVAGLILWLMWKNEKPKTAKAAGIGALVSVIATVVFYILYVCVFAAIGFGAAALY